jgi:hypothetical protein
LISLDAGGAFRDGLLENMACALNHGPMGQLPHEANIKAK